MIGPYLLLQSTPPLQILSVGDAMPGLSYALISGIGPIRRPADGSETANVTIELENADGAASVLFSFPPLRAPAILYGPDGMEWFRGIVAGIILAETARIDLEM